MEASGIRLKIVSGVFSLVNIGVSTSSAEFSKKERAVLSAVRKTTRAVSRVGLAKSRTLAERTEPAAKPSRKSRWSSQLTRDLFNAHAKILGCESGVLLHELYPLFVRPTMVALQSPELCRA